MIVKPTGGPRLELLFGSNSQPKTYKRMFMPSVTDTFHYAAQGNSPAEKTIVQSLMGGGQIFGKVDDMLKLAKSSVLIDLYNFQSPKLYPEKSSPVGMPGAAVQAGLVDKLIELKKRGLDVKVIIDNHWDSELKEGHNNRTIAELRKHGVEVVTYPNFSTISHVKVLVVDDKFAMVGGMNWGNHSPTNHDAAIFIEGADVRSIYNQVFKTDWVSSGRQESELPVMAPFPQGRIKVLQTAARQSATGAKDEIYREILSQIEQAQESIHAELFVLTQKQVIESLLQAHQRLRRAGKEGVKILVDPGLFFSFPGCRAGVQRLAKAGVPIRFFDSNRDIEEKLHAKWAVFDRKNVLIGSANWSNAGLLSNAKPTGPRDADKGGNKERVSKSNHEIALLVSSDKLGKTFADQVLFDWRNASFPILEQVDGKWRPIRPGRPTSTVGAPGGTGGPQTNPPEHKPPKPPSLRFA